MEVAAARLGRRALEARLPELLDHQVDDLMLALELAAHAEEGLEHVSVRQTASGPP